MANNNYMHVPVVVSDPCKASQTTVMKVPKSVLSSEYIWSCWAMRGLILEVHSHQTVVTACSVSVLSPVSQPH